MSIPLHVIPRQTGDKKAERDRAASAKQLLLARYLDPWGTPDIVWCHSHTLVRGYKVILNIYDLLPSRLNGFLSVLHLGGAFHSGIQVGATEYAFGGHPNDDLGIAALKKPLFQLREDAEVAVREGEDEDGSAAENLEWMPRLRSRTVVGWWMGPLSQLEVPLRELRFDESWIGSEYRLLSRNCNHFARAMCAALLRHTMFKPAPGCARPQDMVPYNITRLPALALALGNCVPCVVRQLNAPLPLATYILNAFHGQGRKPGQEVARGKSQAGPRARTAGDMSRPHSIHATAANSGVAAAGGAAGVQQMFVSPSSSAIRVGSAGAGSSETVCWRAGSTTPTTPTPGVPSTAAAAAAAAEGRMLRPRLEGRYRSLRVDTASRLSAERPSRSSRHRVTEDGGGGGGSSGMDTPTEASTACSTPDLAAAATALKAAAAAGTAITTTATAASGNSTSGNTSQPNYCIGLAELNSNIEHWRSQCKNQPTGSANAADMKISATGAAVVPNVVAEAAQPAPNSPAITSITVTTTIAVSPGEPPPVHTEGCSAPSSPRPPVLVTDTGGCGGAVAAAAGTPTQSSTPFSATSNGTAITTTPPRSSAGSKFLNHSRSGRRVFPDPRVPPPGPDGAADGAQDYTAAFGGDGGHLRAHTPDNASFRDRSRGELDKLAAPPGDIISSPRQTPPLPLPLPMLLPSSSSRSQQLLPTPRCPVNSLPPPQPSQLLQPLQTRPDGSATKLVTTMPILPPPAQLLLQHHPQVITSSARSACITSDGAAAAASASGGAARLRMSSDNPRPWSVLSGGFVDLLFSPLATEPPPGVPNTVGASGRGTSFGTHPGTIGGGDAAAAAGGCRRYASFTGDGTGAILSGMSNAALGGLETVNSGDLNDEVQDENLDAAVARVRASTGMLGFTVSGAAKVVEAGPAGAAAIGGGLASALGPTVVAAASPLRPAAVVGRAGSKAGLVVHCAPATGTAAVAAVAAVADGQTMAAPVNRKVLPPPH